MSHNDSFPDLDIAEEQPENTRMYIVGPPPDTSSSDEHSGGLGEEDGISQDEDDRYYPHIHGNRDFNESSDGEMDCEGVLEYRLNYDDEPPRTLPESLIASESAQNQEENGDYEMYINGSDEHYNEQLANMLTAALCADSLNMRKGFSPNDIDEALLKSAKVNLHFACVALLGTEVYRTLPNMSKNEMCQKLAEHNWLIFTGERFFPVLPDSEAAFINEMIDGAEATQKFEETKKKEAESYPNEETEIRTCLVFNLVCELLNRFRNAQQVTLVDLNYLSTEFERMTNGRAHQDLLKKYRDAGLDIQDGEKWEKGWFKQHTNRSSLTKLVQMPRFAGIVAHPNSQFAFRNPDNVKLIGHEVFEAIRQKWRKTGDENNGNNDRRGRNNSIPRNYQSKKREIVPDPDFRPAVLENTEIPNARSRSPSRGRRGSRSPSNTRRGASPSVSPERKFTAPPNPFGGSPPRPRARTPQRARTPERPAVTGAAYDDFSSTGSEFEDEGEYSDEDETKVEERKRKNAENRLRKEKRRAEWAKNPKPAPDMSKNRFNQSSFGGRQEDSPPKERQPSPRQPAPRQPASEVPRQQPGLQFSGSTFNEQAQTKMPFQAPGETVKTNRELEQEKLRKDEARGQKHSAMRDLTSQPQAQAPGAPQCFQQPPQQMRAPFEAPAPVTIPGFAERKNQPYPTSERPTGMARGPPSQQPPQNNYDEEYHGMNGPVGRTPAPAPPPQMNRGPFPPPTSHLNQYQSQQYSNPQQPPPQQFSGHYNHQPQGPPMNQNPPMHQNPQKHQYAQMQQNHQMQQNPQMHQNLPMQQNPPMRQNPQMSYHQQQQQQQNYGHQYPNEQVPMNQYQGQQHFNQQPPRDPFRTVSQNYNQQQPPQDNYYYPPPPPPPQSQQAPLPHPSFHQMHTSHSSAQHHSQQLPYPPPHDSHNHYSQRPFSPPNEDYRSYQQDQQYRNPNNNGYQQRDFSNENRYHKPMPQRNESSSYNHEYNQEFQYEDFSNGTRRGCASDRDQSRRNGPTTSDHSYEPSRSHRRGAISPSGMSALVDRGGYGNDNEEDVNYSKYNVIKYLKERARNFQQVTDKNLRDAVKQGKLEFPVGGDVVEFIKSEMHHDVREERRYDHIYDMSFLCYFLKR